MRKYVLLFLSNLSHWTYKEFYVLKRIDDDYYDDKFTVQNYFWQKVSLFLYPIYWLPIYVLVSKWNMVMLTAVQEACQVDSELASCVWCWWKQLCWTRTSSSVCKKTKYASLMWWCASFRHLPVYTLCLKKVSQSICHLNCNKRWSKFINIGRYICLPNLIQVTELSTTATFLALPWKTDCPDN